VIVEVDQREADAHDGPHQRRDEHRPDDGRRTVAQQTNARDDGGSKVGKDEGPIDARALADGFAADGDRVVHCAPAAAPCDAAPLAQTDRADR